MPKKSTSQSALPENWKPASGWLQETAFGFAGGLGADGQPVALVRLSEVVQWWQKAKGMPRSEVIAAMARALPDDVMDWLYKLKPNERAELVGKGETFRQLTAAGIETSRATLKQGMSQLEFEGKSTSHIKTQLVALSKVVPVDPGRSALVRYLGTFERASPKRNSSGAMVDALDRLPDQVVHLAIPHAKAYELFGWGAVDTDVLQLRAVVADPVEPKTYSDLLKFRESAKKSEWTTSQKSIAATEANRRKALPGSKGVASSMAAELGISVSRFNELIRPPIGAGIRESQRTTRSR